MFCWLGVNSKKELLNHTLWRSGLNHWPLPGFDIIVKEDDTFINDRKVIPELFNGYFVNILGNACETSKMDYVADFMEHLIEHPSIRAKSTTKRKRELFTSEPVNSSLVEQQLSSIKSQKFCGRDVTSKATKSICSRLKKGQLHYYLVFLSG